MKVSCAFSKRTTFRYGPEAAKSSSEESYAYYSQAEQHLTEAWSMCHKDAMKNKE